MNAMLPRWFTTVRVAAPFPALPATRRPSLTNLIFSFENDPKDMFLVEGAVASTLNEEPSGIRKLMFPLIEANR